MELIKVTTDPSTKYPSSQPTPPNPVTDPVSGVAQERIAVVNNAITNVDNRITTVTNNITNIHGTNTAPAEDALSIIQLRNAHPKFVGRKAELTKIHTHFFEEEWHPQDPCKITFLHGVGGMGKSELALSYANSHREDFSFIFTISSQSEELRMGALYKLALQLRVPLEEKDPPEVVQKKLFHHLHSTRFEKPYLLIWDNVEEAIDYPTRNGHILITARNQKVAPHDADLCPIELEPLSEQEGLQLLQKWTGEKESTEMKELFKALGGYPLILSQAAAYIAKNPLRSIAQYLEENRFPEVDPKERYKKTLDQVLTASFNALAKENPQAFEWLTLCSYLHPDNIPLSYLEKHVPDQSEREQIVLALTDASLMHYENKQLSFHRLLAPKLQQEHPDALEKAFSLISSIEFDFETFKDFERLKSTSSLWAPHAALLLTHENLPLKDKASLCHTLGEFERVVLFQYEHSLKYYRRALVAYKELHGEEHVDVADSMHLVGLSLKILGRTEEALEYYEQALAIRKKVHGEQHPRVATSMNNIGAALYSLGRGEEALTYFEEALAVRTKAYGKEHPEVASSLNNIGSSLQNLGRTEEALEYYEQALAIRKKVCGEQHPHVATSMNNIGTALDSLGRAEEALAYQQQALSIGKKAYGEQHPEVAAYLNNIGSSLQQLGHHEEALKHIDQAISIWKKVHGEQHPQLANYLIHIARILEPLGRTEEALECYEQALAIRTKAYGKGHLDVATSLSDIGRILNTLSRPEEALNYHEQALAIRTKAYGKRHPEVATSLSDIGRILYTLSHHQEALNYHEQALAIYKKVHGEQHPDVATSLCNVGSAYHGLKRIAEARECIQQALKIGIKTLPANHPDLRNIREWLAILNTSSGGCSIT